MFINSAFFQKYGRFVDKLAKVLMAETVALTSDRMHVDIRYKSLYMETYMATQIISPPIKLFTLAEIFICKQRNNKIPTWYWLRHDTFCANRPLTALTITLIRCLYRVTGVSIGQGGIHRLIMFVSTRPDVCSITKALPGVLESWREMPFFLSTSHYFQGAREQALNF